MKDDQRGLALADILDSPDAYEADQRLIRFAQAVEKEALERAARFCEEERWTSKEVALAMASHIRSLVTPKGEKKDG
jgi:hypothetical protein